MQRPQLQSREKPLSGSYTKDIPSKATYSSGPYINTNIRHDSRENIHNSNISHSSRIISNGNIYSSGTGFSNGIVSSSVNNNRQSRDNLRDNPTIMNHYKPVSNTSQYAITPTKSSYNPISYSNNSSLSYGATNPIINNTMTNNTITSRSIYPYQQQQQNSSSYVSMTTATPKMLSPNVIRDEKYDQISTSNRSINATTTMDTSYTKSGTSSYSTTTSNNTMYGITPKSNLNTSIRSEIKGLVGLNNIGNTCFMNSILQCLFNAPEFSQYFVLGTYKKELNSKHKDLALAFGNLVEKIHKNIGSPSYSNSESTYEFKRALGRVCPNFCGYDQEDAQEFLKALLEGINDDLNRNRTKQPYKELTIDSRKTKQQLSDEWFNYNIGRDNSIITDLFCGQLLNKVICTECNGESLSFDNFWDLSLSFTRGLSMLESCDLKRMFDHFLKEELLEDLFPCERCKTKRKSKKKFIIWKIPKILVIHLKRFHYGKYRREKLTHKVIFPITGFDLRPYVSESNKCEISELIHYNAMKGNVFVIKIADPSINECIYDLFAIVNHNGGLYSGHYTAECMNQYNKKWYNFNDSIVSELNNSSIERYCKDGGASPYLLFYIKR